MGLFRSALQVAAINFRRWLKDVRVRFTLLFIGYMLYLYISPLSSYAMATDQKCSGWLLPVLFQSSEISIGASKTILHIGMLLLLCDAPFFSSVTPYMILRSKRDGWWLGGCLYIIGAAFLYTLFITFMCIVLLLPVVTLGNDWGGTMKDIVYGITDASKAEAVAESGFLLKVSRDIVRLLFPQGSQLYVFAAVWGSFSFLGLLMYLITLVKKNLLVGMSAAAAFIFLDPLIVSRVSNYGAWMKILSPVTWTSINQTQVLNRYTIMSVPLALGLYVVLIVLMCILIGWYSRRMMIDVNK